MVGASSASVWTSRLNAGVGTVKGGLPDDTDLG
jgi:hypothetical protein